MGTTLPMAGSGQRYMPAIGQFGETCYKTRVDWAGRKLMTVTERLPGEGQRGSQMPPESRKQKPKS